VPPRELVIPVDRPLCLGGIPAVFRKRAQNKRGYAFWLPAHIPHPGGRFGNAWSHISRVSRFVILPL